jgi:hypothetical protein
MYVVNISSFNLLKKRHFSFFHTSLVFLFFNLRHETGVLVPATEQDADAPLDSCLAPIVDPYLSSRIKNLSPEK